MKKNLGILFAVAFMDLLAFSFFFPLLPYYAELFRATPFVAGLLTSAYAVGQVVGAPLIGRLSDRYGRKPLLLLSVAGSLASLVVLGLAGSLAVLFIARFVGGLFGGNLTVVQAYIADVTEEKDRASAFGLIGAAFGLGFVIGPAAGGLLFGLGASLPAFAAAAIEGLTLVLIALVLRESLTEERKEAIRKSPRTAFSLKLLGEALSDRRIDSLLLVRFLTALGFLIFQTNYSLFVQQRLGLDARSTSFTLAYVGVLIVIFQGGLIRPLVKRFDERKLFAVGAALAVAGLGLWAFSMNVAWLLVSLVPLALGQGIVGTLNRSLITTAVEREEVGGVLGLVTGIESGLNVFAPVIGGFLIGGVGAWAPGALGAVLMLGGAVLIATRIVGAGKGKAGIPA